MKLSSLSRLFGKLGLGRSERKPQRLGRPSFSRPVLELLEDRTLLSTSPAAVVTNPNYTTFTGFDPQVAINPLNSQDMVEVSTSGSGLLGEFSVNGGQTWTAFGFGANNGVVGDPTTFNPETPYAYVTSPSVSFDRDGNFYVVSNQFNNNALTLGSSAGDLSSGTTVAGASGAIVFDMFAFNANGTAPTENFSALKTVNVTGVTTTNTTFTNSYGNSTVSNQILYQWEGQDPAFNPTVAVDTDLPATTAGGASFTDPVTGATQTDTMAVSIDPTTGTVAQTYLLGGTQAISATTTVIPITDGAGTTTDPAAGATLTFATGEQVLFVSDNGNGTWNVTRHANGTTATAHSPGEVLSDAKEAAVPKGVYVGWNINFTEPSGSNPAAVSRVMIAASGDGGNNFTTNQYADTANTSGVNGSGVGSAPLFLFTQGSAIPSATPTAIPTVPGGQFNILYGDDTSFFSTGAASGESNAVIQQSLPDGGVVGNDVAAAATFQGTTGNVNDANGGTHTETWNVVSEISPTEITVTHNGALTPPPNGSTVTFSDGTTDTINHILVGSAQDSWFFNSALTNPENAPATVSFTTSTSTAITTDFTINVGSTGVTVGSTGFPTDFTTIEDLEVTLDLAEANMNQMSIVLIPPTGSTLAPITLLSNGTASSGGGSGLVGLAGLSNLGVAPGSAFGSTIHNVGTVFDDDAPRLITDGSATAPWIGHFKPTSDTVNGSVTITTGTLDVGQTATGNPSEVDGLATNSAQVDGVWTLEITNYVSQRGQTPGPAVGTLTGFFMHFTGLISTSGFGANADNGSTAGEPNYQTTTAQRDADNSLTVPLVITNGGNTAIIGAGGALAGSPSNLYTAGSAGASGPGFTAAFDNTLGSFSPYQGRLYIAYVGNAAANSGASANTNIYVATSDDDGAAFNASVQVNDDTAADNFSEGNRSMFMPSIAVDPVTGSVVVDYYDGRYDADNVRFATSISYSVDGGNDWSTSTTLNQETTATDAITNDIIDVAPIPGNEPAVGNVTGSFDPGFGDRQGLVVFDGDVIPFFTSNLNSAGVEVMTADVTIPSGPVVVGGDMGPIVNDFNYAPTVYDDGYSTYTGTGTTYAPITYNNLFYRGAETGANSYPDGTRELDQFEVTFDRPVDINSFTTKQIQVMYESPTSTTKVPIAVASITALDNLTEFGPDLVGLGTLATQFLITLVAPQFAVGTYSYAIGLDSTTVSNAGLTATQTWTLTSAITPTMASGSTFTVTGTTPPQPPSTPFVVTIDNEQILISSTTAPGNNETWTIMQRGYNGTIPATHNSGATVIIPTTISDNVRISDDIRSIPTGTAAQFAGPTENTDAFNNGATVLLGGYMNQNSGAYTDVTQVQGLNTITANSYTTAVALSATTKTAGPITYTDPYQQVREDQKDPIQVKLDITGAPDTTTTLALALMSPMGTSVSLGSWTVETADNGDATVYFSDFAPPGVTATNTGASRVFVDRPTATGAANEVTPGMALSTLLNQLVNGNWTLNISSTSTGFTLSDWSLLVPLTTNVFALPDPVNGMPFVAGYNPDTLPLIIPGPHVVSTSVVSANPYFSAFVPGTTDTTNPVPYVYDQWTLASAINTIAANTLTVDAGGPPTPTTPFVVTIDNEQMLISAVNGDTWTILTRGYDMVGGGGAPAVHNAGAVDNITLAAKHPGTGTDVTVAAGMSTANTVQVTDDYEVEQNVTNPIQVAVNFNATTAGTLTLQLQAQDGTVVNLGTVTTTSGLHPYIFNDFGSNGATVPPTVMGAPALGALVGESTEGDWTLVLTSGTAAGTLNSWTLQLPHTTADNEALDSTATGLLVTFDRDMNPSSFTAAAVNQMIGPLGAITGPYTIIADPAGTPAALAKRVFEITFPTQSLNGNYTLSINPTATDTGSTSPQYTTSGNAVDSNFNAGLDRLEGTAPPNGIVTTTPYATAPGQTVALLPNSSPTTSTISIADSFTIAQPLETWMLASAITANQTTLTIQSGSNFTPPAQNFFVEIDAGKANAEIMEIQGGPTTTTWTILARGQDGTTAQSHAAGATITFTSDQIQLELNIAAPSGSALTNTDLQAELISPSGTVIQLFTGSNLSGGHPESAVGGELFNSTVFDDFATTAIQNGNVPYSSVSGVTYNPQEPLSALDGQNTAGTWQLVITNTGTGATDIGTLMGWSLVFPHAAADTGLGQGIGQGDADQISTGFRIFNEDPSNASTTEQWTAVGPAADNNGVNTGPVNAIAVDPSDPSGNTVYVASATGGLWKTTNFLTTNPAGPTYIPLTNLGPTGSLNISSIAVFGVNDNPSQSVIYAITGNPNAVTASINPQTGGSNAAIPGNIGNPNDNAAGIGLIVSHDGGQTWQILDSSHNDYDPSNDGSGGAGNTALDGTPLPESDTAANARDHLFVGLVGFQVAVDPTLLNGQIVVYAAFSNGTTISGVQNNKGGVYRSLDGGVDWTLVPTNYTAAATPLQSGNATSVVLAAASGDAFGQPAGNLEDLYAGFANQGVFTTQNATGATALGQLASSPAPNRFVGTTTSISNTPIPTSASSNPNGAISSRIVLATPALTTSPEENLFYSGWVYAAVVNTSGTGLQGLYVSKDFSATWTQIQLPDLGGFFGTNNFTRADINTVAGDPVTGPINVTLAIDPTNPEIVYLGGGGSNLLAIDIANLSDPYALVGYNNISALANQGAGLVQNSTTGPASVTTPGAKYGVLETPGSTSPPYTIEEGATGTTNYYNLYKDPQNPFLSTGSVLYLDNISAFNNQGTGALWGEIGNLTNAQGNSILGITDFTDNNTTLDMRALVAVVDPLTGETRLLVGNDMGVYTGVDPTLGTPEQAVTTIQGNVGSAVEVTGTRNGNLQLAAMADSATQPSAIAAAAAQALFYGDSQYTNGFPHSTPDILDTGDLNWTGLSAAPNPAGTPAFYGNGESVATSQSNLGELYQVDWANLNAINLFPNNNNAFFLATPPGGATTSPGAPAYSVAGFPLQGGSRVAVNPINSQELLLGSQTGIVYFSNNGGQNWFPTSTATGSTFLANALAFGAPDPAYPGRNDNGFIYAGTVNGQIFVSIDEGSSWTTTKGLDGSAVEQIVTDPNPGAYDAFAVTQNGVYYMNMTVVSGSITSATWVNITNNLFGTTRPLFNNANNQFATLVSGSLTSIAVDWRFAVPTSNTAYASGKVPVLYVGGDGGVFRSEDGGTTWTNFPNVTQTWTLATPLTPTGNTLQVSNPGPTTPPPPATPFTITIGGEEMLVTNTTNTWTLAAGYTPGATSLTVNSGPTTPSGNFAITIDGEQFVVSATSATSWKIVTAGANGTKDVTHLAGATVTNNTLWTVAESQWTLAGGGITSNTQATLTVSAGPTPPNGPFYIIIGTEEMEVTATSATTWTILARGVDGTTKANHASGVSVFNRAQDGTQDLTASASYAAGTSLVNNGDNAVQQGGLFPDMQVTSLQLATGNINPANGLPISSNGYNLLLASTYGEGDFAIHLDNSAILGDIVAPVSTAGPVVVSIAPVTANAGLTLTGITITFNEPIDPQTLKAQNIVVYDPHGAQLLVVQSITEIGPSQYQANFVKGDNTVGIYSVSISGATDNAGDLMTPFHGQLVFPAETPEAVFDFPVNAPVQSPAPGDGVYVFRSKSGFQQINAANASVLAINATANNTYAVAGSFPGFGVLVYSSTTGVWTPLNSATAAALAVDPNGDVFVSFGSPFNQVVEYQFQPLTGSYNPIVINGGASAASLAVDNNGNLFAAFPSGGLLEYKAGSTTPITINGAGATVVAVNGAGTTLAVMFTGFGVYKYINGPTFAYAGTLNGATASALAVDSSGDVFAAFPNSNGTQGLLEYIGTTASVVNITTPSGMAFDTAGNLYASFPKYGVFEYTPPPSGADRAPYFLQLTLSNVSVANAQEDTNGDLFAATPGQGLWKFTLGTTPGTDGWVRINAVAPTIMAVDGQGDVAAGFSSGGLLERPYTATGATGWVTLNGSSVPGALAIYNPAGTPPQINYIVAAFGSAGVYEYVNAAPSSTPINTGNANSLAVDGAGNLYAAFASGGVLERPLTAPNNTTTGWTVLNGASASLVAADAAGDVAAFFSGFGVLERPAGSVGTSGWVTLNTATASLLAFDANRALLADFPNNNVLLRYPSAAASSAQMVATPGGANPTSVSDDADGDVFLNFPDGYYQYTVGLGFELLISAGGDALALA